MTSIGKAAINGLAASLSPAGSLPGITGERFGLSVSFAPPGTGHGAVW